MGDGIDILAGGDFHQINDIMPRMYDNTVIMKNSIIVQCASPAILKLDKLELKQKLVSVAKQVSVSPGDYIEIDVPPEFNDEEHLMVEPNINQCKPFFTSTITAPVNGKIHVENSSENVTVLKKNCKPFVIRRTKVLDLPSPIPKPYTPIPQPVKNPTEKEILSQIKLCLLYTSPSPRDLSTSRMPSSA